MRSKDEIRRLVTKLQNLTSPLPWQLALDNKEMAFKYRKLAIEAGRKGNREESERFHELADYYAERWIQFGKPQALVCTLTLELPEVPVMYGLLDASYDPREAAELTKQIVEALMNRLSK